MVLPPVAQKLKSHHASKEETAQRVGIVMEMLVRGIRRSDICQYVAKTWPVAECAGDVYIRRAKDLLAAYYAGTRRDVEAGKSLMRMENAFRELTKANQHAEAANVQKHINKLLGLDA